MKKIFEPIAVLLGSIAIGFGFIFLDLPDDDAIADDGAEEAIKDYERHLQVSDGAAKNFKKLEKDRCRNLN